MRFTTDTFPDTVWNTTFDPPVMRRISSGNALLGLEMLRDDACDLAHGSRRHIASDILKSQPWYRRMLSRAFKATVRMLLRVPRELTDTQCGFKMYRGDVARELYGQCITDGFMFDIEVILRAAKKGYRIAEFPVEWTCDIDSRLSVARTPWPVLLRLALEAVVADGTVVALLDPERFPRLTHLRAQVLGPGAWDALAAAERPPPLRQLELFDPNLRRGNCLEWVSRAYPQLSGVGELKLLGSGCAYTGPGEAVLREEGWTFR